MAHIVNPDREYHLLQQRLDRHVTGAPESPVLTKILRLLYSPEEARLARRLARDTGFEIEGHVLEFTGLCPACQSAG